MSADGHGTKCRRNIAENFNRLSRVHKRYRQMTDRRTGDSIYSERERELTFAKNGSPYAIEPLSSLCATLVYCGQTVGWIKIKLGAEVGLMPRPSLHCV